MSINTYRNIYTYIYVYIIYIYIINKLSVSQVCHPILRVVVIDADQKAAPPAP